MSLRVLDLLVGSDASHRLVVPPTLFGTRPQEDDPTVTVRPLTVGDIALITRAAKDDPSLFPLLMLSRAMTDPVLTVNDARSMPAGLAVWLVDQISRVSGLSAGSGSDIVAARESPVGSAYLTLARTFGWTPEQVDRLTPAQLALFVTAPTPGEVVSG